MYICSIDLQYDLLRDYKALNTLRELLVIIRIWGLLRKTCLPVFVRCSDSLDILAHIFKLLTRLVQSPEPDESLIGMLPLNRFLGTIFNFLPGNFYSCFLCCR